MNDLERQARQVIARASVIAEADGRGVGEFTTHGKTGTRVPTIGGKSSFDWAVSQLTNAKGPHSLALAIERVTEELDTLQGRRERPKPTFKQTILLEWEGHHYTAVGQVTATHPRPPLA